jgi:hypothetical protein
MRSTKTLARNAPGNATDQKRKGEHLRGDDAAQSEHGNLDHAGRDRDHRVGGDYGRAFEAAISSDSRITPEPEVPPTRTP